MSLAAPPTPRKSKRVAGKPPPSPPSNATENIDYRIGEVPLPLLSKTLDNCFLEILNAGPMNLTESEEEDEAFEGKKKNHVILRASFKREIAEATPFAPAGVKGIKLSIEPDSTVQVQNADEFGSRVLVKTAAYSTPSYSCLGAIPIPLRSHNITLRQLLRPVIANHMANFVFVNDGRGLMGCRDWVSQVVRQLETAALVDVNAGEESAYRALGYRYFEDGGKLPKAVEKGRFASYTRLNIPEIMYT